MQRLEAPIVLHSLEGILLRDFLKSASSHLTLATPQSLLAFVVGNTLMFLITLNASELIGLTAGQGLLCLDTVFGFVFKSMTGKKKLLYKETSQGKVKLLWTALNTSHLSLPTQ